jgi:hypothetical protein
VDNTAPTLVIGSPSSSITKGGPVTFTVTWSDADFDSSSISLLASQVIINKTGSALVGSTSISGSGNTRTIQLDGITGDGSVGISLPANTAFDLSANPAPATGPSATFIVDNTVPAIAISAPSTTITKAGPVTFTVTWSDANLDSSSIALLASQVIINKTGSSLIGSTSISGSGNTRIVQLDGITGDGTVSISLPANTASDLAVNLAPAAGPSATFTVDNTPPLPPVIAGISTDTGSSSADAVTSDRTLVFFGTAEAGSTLTLTRVGTGVIGTVTADGSGAWTVDYTGTVLSDGTYSFTATSTDSVGNLSTASNPFVVKIDTAPPTLSIGAPSISASKLGPVDYLLTYGGAAQISLKASDITLNATGTANGTVFVLNVGGSWIVSIANLTGQGTLGFSVAAGTAQNLAGTLASAAGPSATFRVGNTAPTLPVNTTITLAGTQEITPSPATRVSDMLVLAGLSDFDPHDTSGIAVTDSSGTGFWQYSLNNSDWTPFGSVSADQALLLSSDTYIRYLPVTGEGETATLTFRAWDQTTGTASLKNAPSYAGSSAAGGFTGFSAQTALANLVVLSSTLTSFDPLTGAIEDTSFSITYAALVAARNEDALAGDTNAFLIVDVRSGTLTEDGQSVIPGVTTFSPGQVLVWTPAPDANGPAVAAFTVKATNITLPAPEPVLVPVQVSEVNDAPTTSPDFVSLGEETSLFVQTSVLLANDLAGPANESSQTLAISSVDSTSANGGSVVWDQSSGLIRYSPAPAFLGVDSFIYTVTDNGTTAGVLDSKSSQGTVFVTVKKASDFPFILSDSLVDRTVEELSELSFIVNVADEVGVTFRFSLGTNAPAGASIDATSGLFRWTPTEAQGPGVYQVPVQVVDSPNAVATGFFKVTVTERNTPPVLGPLPDLVLFDTGPLNVSVTATDSDLPANVLTYSLLTGPTGAAIDPLTGILSWKPGSVDAPRVEAFTVTVNDNGQPNLTDQKSFSVTVKPGLRITEEPVDQSVPLDGTATFRIVVADQNSLTYQWLYQGTPLADETNATLVITHARVEDAGDYQVIVRSSSQEVQSRVVHLTVVSAPPLSFLSITHPSGSQTAHLTFTGPAGGTYALYSSSDLVHWTFLTNVMFDSNPAAFDDNTTAPQTFYQLTSLNP